jgi:radical SAM protein with 4Fe4S-binding SPASM domain
VFLDPSDICNAKCPWCPTGSGEIKKYRRQQLMEFDLYRKIIDDLARMPEKIKTLRLYMMGEPLLNERFPKMVAYAKATGRFGQIDTTTNGLLLDTNEILRLSDCGLDKIFISVPQNYTKKYVSNVAYFRLSSDTQLYVKIIGDGLMESQKERFFDDFGDFTDRIFIENLSPCWPGYDVKGVNKKVGIYGQPIKEVQVCSYIFYSLAINSDGTVSLCFLDWKHDMILGDLKKESFKDIWNGSKLLNYRKIHLKKVRKLFPPCANCDQLSYGAPDDIDPYAQDILRRIE